jgi:hypothetical protein
VRLEDQLAASIAGDLFAVARRMAALRRGAANWYEAEEFGSEEESDCEARELQEARLRSESK